ncbi:hypothetical protein TCAL_13960, partial [Tigriopus californicus]|eukprot:TCALIF_13960-PA protein Name:"Protein of unknown function" AED:0.14 eAED:0.14 QI:20/1/0.33/1/0/0/3/0/213
MLTLPVGSFTQIMEQRFINVIACLSNCKAGIGCNALFIGPDSCLGGTVDLNYTGLTSEPKQNYYVERDLICSHNSENSFTTFPTRMAMNGKFVFNAGNTSAMEAESHCQSLNASLVTLKSKEEFQGLANLTGSKIVHIGLSSDGYRLDCENESCGNKLQWTDGTPFRYSKKFGYVLQVNEGGQAHRFLKSGSTILLQDSEPQLLADAVCEVKC